MPISIIEWSFRHTGDLLLIGLTAASQKAVSDNECGAQRHRRAAAAGVDQATNGLHRSSPWRHLIENKAELAVVAVRRWRSRPAGAVDAIELAEQDLRRIARIGETVVRPR